MHSVGMLTRVRSRLAPHRTLAPLAKLAAALLVASLAFATPPWALAGKVKDLPVCVTFEPQSGDGITSDGEGAYCDDSQIGGNGGFVFKAEPPRAVMLEFSECLESCDSGLAPSGLHNVRMAGGALCTDPPDVDLLSLDETDPPRDICTAVNILNYGGPNGGSLHLLFQGETLGKPVLLCPPAGSNETGNYPAVVRDPGNVWHVSSETGDVACLYENLGKGKAPKLHGIFNMPFGIKLEEADDPGQCNLGQKGDSCSVDSQCCSNKCKGNGTCR